MKTYRCICRVCGTLHDIKADFLSSPCSMVKDGISYPVSACPGKHTQEEIKESVRARNNATVLEASVNDLLGRE